MERRCEAEKKRGGSNEVEEGERRCGGAGGGERGLRWE